MEGIEPGWRVPPELRGKQLPGASLIDTLRQMADAEAEAAE